MKSKQINHNFKIGFRVPDGDINLAYFSVPELSAENNVVVADFSSSVTHKIVSIGETAIKEEPQNDLTFSVNLFIRPGPDAFGIELQQFVDSTNFSVFLKEALDFLSRKERLLVDSTVQNYYTNSGNQSIRYNVYNSIHSLFRNRPGLSIKKIDFTQSQMQIQNTQPTILPPAGILKNVSVVANLDTEFSRQIKVFSPEVVDDINDPWYLRVRHGFFRMFYTVTGNEKEVEYRPYIGKEVVLLFDTYQPFLKQHFVHGNASPESFLNNGWLKSVLSENPRILSDNKIQVSNKPLFFWNQSVIKNDRGKIRISFNGIDLEENRIENIERETGIITIRGTIGLRDEIFVDYWYETDTFDFQSFAMDSTGNNFRVDMDINPLPGHAGSSYFGRQMYIYLKPYAMIVSNSIFNIPSVFPELELAPGDWSYIDLSAKIQHPVNQIYFDIPKRFKQVYMTFNPEIFRNPGIQRDPTSVYGGFYLDGKPAAKLGEIVLGGVPQVKNIFFDPTATLIASVFLNVDIKTENIKLMDTRSRGGGLKENIDLEDARKKQPEIEYFWELSSWDGRSFMENGVFVLEVSKTLLKVNGGDYTEEQIQGIVQERSALGVLPIIRYL